MPKFKLIPALATSLRRRPGIRACGLVLIMATSGCGAGSAHAPAPKKTTSEILASAPAWVTRGCRAHWQDAEARRKVVCGIGSAPAHRNRVAARETAIARARASLARSFSVTIESLVRVSDRGDDEGEFTEIVHQVSSTSLRGLQLEATWRSETDEIHALVSLGLDQVQRSVRNTHSLSPAEREGLAERAAAAFAEMDAAFEKNSTADSGGDVSLAEP